MRDSKDKPVGAEFLPLDDPFELKDVALPGGPSSLTVEAEIACRQWETQKLNQPLNAEYHERFKNDPEYVLEGLYLELFEQIRKFMHRNKITDAELAQKLGVTEEYVKDLFRETHNLTLLTLSKLFAALGAEAKIRLTSVS